MDHDDATTTVLDLQGEAAPSVPGYRITRCIGRGSTATVWRARRTSDDALFALKVLDHEADDAAVREYSLLQATALEHTVQVHELLTIDGEAGPRTVLVLDHMAAGSLADVISGRGFLSPGETVTVIAPLATALGQLHRLGVVHGDPSPGNVLLDSTGRPVWSDLGYARLTGIDPADDDVWGTEGYLAPEVVLGRDPTAAADVYGIGALAWLCLTGTTPGHIATRGDLRELAPTTPPALVDLVQSCLDPDPAQRPDVDDLARAVFDSASAEPLTLVVAADLTTSLTRRIREAAAKDPGEVPVWERDLAAEAQPPTRWWRRAPRTPEPDATWETTSRRHAAPRLTDAPDAPDTAETRRSRREGAHAASGSARPGLRWVMTLAAAVAVGLVLSLAVPWDRLASADAPAVTPSTRAATEASSPKTSVARPPESALLADQDSARRSPAAVLTELVDLRAQLLTTRDTSLVTEVNARGSASAQDDAALLRTLVDGGHSYRDLRFTVRSATARSTTGEEVVVRSVVDTSAYTVIGTRGGRKPAAKGTPTDVTLRYLGGRWRIVDVVAARR